MLKEDTNLWHSHAIKVTFNVRLVLLKQKALKSRSAALPANTEIKILAIKKKMLGDYFTQCTRRIPQSCCWYIPLNQRSKNIPLYSISWATNAQGSCCLPTNKPSRCFGLTLHFSRRIQLKTWFLLRGQNRLASLLKLSRINGGEI